MLSPGGAFETDESDGRAHSNSPGSRRRPLHQTNHGRTGTKDYRASTGDPQIIPFHPPADVRRTGKLIGESRNDREVARLEPKVDLLGFDRRGSAVFEYMPDEEGVAPG
jgi:hypothetical protein